MPDSRMPQAQIEEESAWIEPIVPNLADKLELSAEAQKHNVQDLLDLFYRGTQAPQAVKLFRDIATGKSKEKLKQVLRDHQHEPIYRGEEIGWREAFDHLLFYYSVLELGLQVGYIGELPRGTSRTISQILEQRWVRVYYEQHYPLLLPQLLRERLAGGRYYRAHRGPRQVAALQRATELGNRLLQNPEVQVFLALADDFYLDGYARQDLLKVVKEPRKLLKSLTRRGSKQSTLDQAVGGLRRFLFLCDGLDRVLRTLEGEPVYQSAIWHLFGYWFAERREEVVPSLRKILKQLERWPALSEADAALPTGRRTVELRASIEALASGRYGEALRTGWEARS